MMKMLNKILSASLFCILLVVSPGVKASGIIAISTQDSELIFKVDAQQRLFHSYFGQRLNSAEHQGMNTPKAVAYPSFGGPHVNEAALRVVHADGNTSTDLRYVTHGQQEVSPGIILTTIEMKDDHYPFLVHFKFKAFQKENIIEQWVEMSHQEEQAVTLYNYASSHLYFSEPAYHMTQFFGNWADEMHMEESKLTRGVKVVDSKLGVRSNQHAHANFLLSLDGPLQENTGRVIGGTLAWPGSWALTFDVDHLDNLNVISGINPYAAHYRLKPGELFKTPSMLVSFSAEGSGDVTRNFHSWAIRHGIHRGDRTRLTLLNNWEATYFDFNEEILTGIIQDAAEMDFELFLLDDGWFGQKHPRNDDHAGLGDWVVNREKLPNGIGYLVQEAKRNNIRFGLWLEPEMVNPRSELYEKHPDWVIGQPHRELDLSRNQLNLDLANPQVQQFVYDVIDQTLTRNPGIAYIKWDANRFITNSGSYYLSPEEQSHLWIENVKGLFIVLEKVREKYNDVFMMVCSGGGGRLDYGTLPYFDEFWISDNTDALTRIYIQWGTTYFFPAMALASHVSVTPNHITGRDLPLKFRFDVAMSAKLGMDLQPSDMSEKDKAFSKNAIQEYYGIRDIVQFGSLFRLLSPYTNERTAMMYVSEQADKAVVFAYLLKKDVYGNNQPLLLQGLDPDKMYSVKEVNKDPDSYSWVSTLEGKTFSGDFLMKYGLRFPMYNEFDSKIIQLTEVAAEQKQQKSNKRR